jgi:hypothetical protein
MIKIDSKKEYDLNNMNVAAQNIQLGTYLEELTVNYNKTGGSSTLSEDLFFPLTAGKVGVVDQPPFSTTEIAYLFPANDASQVIYVIGEMPDGWAIGTDIMPHVHWKQTHSGSVVYKIDYKWFNNGSNVPDTFSTYVMSTNENPYTSGSILQETSGSAFISGSHITGESSMFLIKLYRDDNTYTGNAITYQFDITIQKESFGGSE